MIRAALTRWGPVPAVLLMMGNPAVADARVIYLESEVEAPVERVFDAWASAEGLRWFGKAVVQPRVGGAYELHFLPDAPKGQRGSEGGRVLALVPNRLLTVEWAMPPYMQAIRPHQTVLTLTFEPVGDRTRFTLTHAGFGRGPEWDKGLEYFQRAWPEVLMQMREAVEAQ